MSAADQGRSHNKMDAPTEVGTHNILEVQKDYQGQPISLVTRQITNSKCTFSLPDGY
jgi:hypothetical protein